MKITVACGYDRCMSPRLPWFASLFLSAVLGVLGGCQSPRVIRPSTPAPILQLASAAPMQIATDCRPGGSVVVDFVVQPDGSTSAIRVPAVPECLRDALTAWVASFRYLPPRTAVPGTVEWLLVSAQKGG